MNIPISRRATVDDNYSSTSDSSMGYDRTRLTWEEEEEMQLLLADEGFDVEELGILCM